MNARGLVNMALALTACLALGSCGAPATNNDPAPTVPRFFLEAVDQRSMSVTLPKSGVQIAVNAQPVVTEGDIVDVAVAQVDLGKCLMFQVAPSAARDLYRLTASHQGRRLVLVINGTPYGARRIDGPIGDGVIFVFVEVADEALPKLAEDLKRTSTALQRELARKG
jgi:hypothetical protein